MGEPGNTRLRKLVSRVWTETVQPIVRVRGGKCKAYVRDSRGKGHQKGHHRRDSATLKLSSKKRGVQKKTVVKRFSIKGGMGVVGELLHSGGEGGAYGGKIVQWRERQIWRSRSKQAGSTLGGRKRMGSTLPLQGNALLKGKG